MTVGEIEFKLKMIAYHYIESDLKHGIIDIRVNNVGGFQPSKKAWLIQISVTSLHCEDNYRSIAEYQEGQKKHENNNEDTIPHCSNESISMHHVRQGLVEIVATTSNHHPFSLQNNL